LFFLGPQISFGTKSIRHESTKTEKKKKQQKKTAETCCLEDVFSCPSHNLVGEQGRRPFILIFYYHLMKGLASGTSPPRGHVHRGPWKRPSLELATDRRNSASGPERFCPRCVGHSGAFSKQTKISKTKQNKQNTHSRVGGREGKAATGSAAQFKLYLSTFTFPLKNRRKRRERKTREKAFSFFPYLSPFFNSQTIPPPRLPPPLSLCSLLPPLSPFFSPPRPVGRKGRSLDPLVCSFREGPATMNEYENRAGYGYGAGHPRAAASSPAPTR